ncbi:MAG: DUF4382 domain-containing protein [Ignavibacteriaceae bacterium]
MKNKIVASLFFLLFTALYVVSCSDNVTDPVQSGNGRLKLLMVDSPATLDSVIINVIEVSVHYAGNDSTENGWMVINSTERYFDLLQLTNGAMAVLGDTTLPAGKYTQIRLLLGDDNYVYDDGVRYDLTTPSAQQSGLKLIHPFDILPGIVYELYLDFNVDKSVHVTGNGKYMLKPTIRVQTAAASGSISGQVLPLDANPVIWTVAGEDTVSTFTDENGFFTLMALPQGTYNVNIDPANPAYLPVVINDVIVTANNDTDIGILTLDDVTDEERAIAE